jgi:hypothetical protein
VSDLSSQISPLTIRLNQQDDTLKAVASRIDQVSQASLAGQTSLRTELLGAINQRDQNLATQLDKRFGQVATDQATLQDRLLKEMDSRLQTKFTTVDSRLSQLALAQDSLRSDFQGKSQPSSRKKWSALPLLPVRLAQ